MIGDPELGVPNLTKTEQDRRERCSLQRIAV